MAAVPVVDQRARGVLATFRIGEFMLFSGDCWSSIWLVEVIDRSDEVGNEF